MLEKLKPEKVFTYFEEISRIPRGSGNTKQISDYLAAFARNRKLQYYQDERNNVIIIKEATAGYEQQPPIILQGHMDMVAVKEEGCSIDMSKEGLRLGIDGDLIYAEGTSLGADDGVAVAYALAVLDSDTLGHPRLEAVFTVDEEVGMEGALFIDVSMLKGKRLLNIDSEKEGELTVSCAGGVRVRGTFSEIFETIPGTEEDVILEIGLDGLTGGHSGTEIHHGRANANVLMGRLLCVLSGELELRLVRLGGGSKDNVIPNQASAEVLIKKEYQKRAEELLAEYESGLREQYQDTDPGLRVTARASAPQREVTTVKIEKLKNILSFLQNAKNGVQFMSRELPNMVETSLNLGVIRTGQGLEIDYSIRSSKKSAKDALCQELCLSFAEAGAEVALSGDYPAWEWKKDSALTAQMQAVYEELFGEKPVVLAVHAGLECGILADKIKGLDSVSFGPDIYDIHTTKERLSISSAQRMWEYLTAILERKV